MVFVCLVFSSLLWAQKAPPKIFGIGGYLQGGNSHENLGAIGHYRFDPGFGIDLVLSSELDLGSYSTNIRFLKIMSDLLKFPQGTTNVYLGGGGGFAGWNGGSALKLIGSVGLGYEFLTAPLEVFILLDPTIQKNISGGGGSDFYTTLKIGARYFFF